MADDSLSIDHRKQTDDIHPEISTDAKGETSSFTEVSLEDINKRPKKLPKRIVHFSDGVLEEYSSDEDDKDAPDNQPLIDPKTLPWIPYLWYLTWWLGSRTLAVCDYLGEHLAYFFGITSPKFQYELDEFQRMVDEEEKLKQHLTEENAGWGQSGGSADPLNSIEVEPLPINASPVSSQPSSPALTNIAKGSTQSQTRTDSQQWERY